MTDDLKTIPALAAWSDDPATWFNGLPEAMRDALEVAALLGAFDAGTLASATNTTTIWIPRWIDAELLDPVGSLYQVKPALCDAIIDGLFEPPPRFAVVGTLMLQRLSVPLTGDDADAEMMYMRALETVCELAIQRAPADLAAIANIGVTGQVRVPAHRNLTRYYHGLGHGLLERFDDARTVFDDVLEQPEIDDGLRARVLNSSATFARLQGDYERARAGFRESDAIWERLGNVARQGLARMNQGILGYYLQDYETAAHDLATSLAMFQEAGATQWQAMAYSNLGLVARDRGRWYDALAYFEQARTMFQEDSPLDYQGYVSNNIGEVELLRGRYAEARGWFEQALSQWNTRSFAVDTHLNLGLEREAQHDYEAAILHYQRSLDLALALKRLEIVALLHYRIGRTAQQQGHYQRAQGHFDKAIATIEDRRAPMRDEGLMISLMGRWQQVYEAATLLAVERGLVEDAFAYAERARARAFSDVLTRHGTGVADANVPPVTAQDVQAVLPPDVVLLSYVGMGLRGPESDLVKAMPSEAAGLRQCLMTVAQTLVFALTTETITVHVCAIDPNVFQPSSALRADGERFLNPRLLHKAYRALIGPVAATLDTAKAIIIAPHGPLHQLPFSALVDDEGQPMVLGIPLTYTPSATILHRSLTMVTNRPADLEPCLAVGYDGTAFGLRHTEPEAERIARRCNGVAWRGEVGIRQRLQDNAGRFRWLHLACHGEFDHADPLHSRLEIGPDEIVRADEVIASYQLHADLVTLSACRSGLSRVLRGDEPMGLVRAFLYAGARAVLVTLWQVEDRSARLLMERFYAEMMAQTRPDPAAALRTAQQYLRTLTSVDVRSALEEWGEELEPDGGDELPFADPRFWAAYVIVGAPR